MIQKYSKNIIIKYDYKYKIISMLKHLGYCKSGLQLFRISKIIFFS